MPKPPPSFPGASINPMRGLVRVTNILPVITCEGDLIVAGTSGTLVAWVPGPENELLIEAADHRALVNVAWDDYMFVDSGQDKDPPESCTLSKKDFFVWHTEVKNLRRV